MHVINRWISQSSHLLFAVLLQVVGLYLHAPTNDIIRKLDGYERHSDISPQTYASTIETSQYWHAVQCTATLSEMMSKLNSIITFDQLSALLIVQLRLPSFSPKQYNFFLQRTKGIMSECVGKRNFKSLYFVLVWRPVPSVKIPHDNYTAHVQTRQWIISFYVWTWV